MSDEKTAPDEATLAKVALDGYSHGLAAETARQLGSDPVTPPDDEDPTTPTWNVGFAIGKEQAATHAGSATARV